MAARPPEPLNRLLLIVNTQEAPTLTADLRNPTTSGSGHGEGTLITEGYGRRRAKTSHGGHHFDYYSKEGADGGAKHRWTVETVPKPLNPGITPKARRQHWPPGHDWLVSTGYSSRAAPPQRKPTYTKRAETSDPPGLKQCQGRTPTLLGSCSLALGL